MNTVSLMEDEEDKINASYSKFGYNDDHICDAWKDLYCIVNFIPALSTEMPNLRAWDRVPKLLLKLLSF